MSIPDICSLSIRSPSPQHPSPRSHVSSQSHAWGESKVSGAFSIQQRRSGQYVTIKTKQHTVRVHIATSAFKNTANIVWQQTRLIVPRTLSNCTTKQALLLLVRIKYDIHILEDQLFGASTDDSSDDNANLSDELMGKEFRRAQLELKLYGDALAKRKRSCMMESTNKPVASRAMRKAGRQSGKFIYRRKSQPG